MAARSFAGSLALYGGVWPVRALVVVAHPDDETIGVGARLPRLPQAFVVHVTDGAPIDRSLANPLNDPPRLAYRATRAAERDRALTRMGIGPERRASLDAVDQHAVEELPRLARHLAELIGSYRPEFVLTHPYEGGHPDHDATAWVVHAARALAFPGMPIVEMAFYHAGSGGMVTERFLDERDAFIAPLDAEERALKEELRRIHASQLNALRSFRFESERFRPAPAYDFRRPPHAGALHYEREGWGVDGATWRRLADEAGKALGLGDPPWA